MMTASHAASSSKSVVARSRSAATSSRTAAALDVADVGLAAVDGGGLLLVDLEADRAEAVGGELDQQREADVAEADDADARRRATRSGLLISSLIIKGLPREARPESGG